MLRPFYPALDGVRALAILLVFSWHFCRVISSSSLFLWGWVGVNVFFVLSGFLITGILCDSLGRNDFFRGFYIRRSLRIFPLYYAVWLCVLLATPLLHIQWNRYVVNMALYFGNFFKEATHSHPDPGALVFTIRHKTRIVLIDHFWSLCVEEQFYLVWPLIVWRIRSLRHLLFLCVGLVALAPIGRHIYQSLHPGSNFIVLYYNTFSRADALLLGAAVALWLRCSAPAPHILRRIAVAALLLGPSLLLGLRFLYKTVALFPIEDSVVLTVGFSLINIASAGLLLLALEPKSMLVSVLKLRPLVFLGRISYGLYIFNELLYMELLRFDHLPFGSRVGKYLFTPLCFAIVLGVALLSFRFIESPFLRLKNKFAPRPGTVEDPPASRS